MFVNHLQLKDDDSISAIQHFYISKSLRGEKLRKAVESDKKYQRIMKKRANKLANRKISKKYVMSVDEDYEIMDLIYRLEKRKLSQSDREVIKLLKTQLEHDWRRPLKRFLERMVSKYDI